MLVSDRYKLIFIHIPRTAGTFVREVMKNLDPDIREVGNLHETARNGIKLLSPRIWYSYVKFAVARNSWDWQVSLYLNMLVQGGAFQNAVIKNMGFKQYLKWRSMEVTQQIDYIMDKEGSCLVDNTLSFDQLNYDLVTFFKEHTGLDITSALPKIKFKASVRKKKKEYWVFYNASSRKLVEKIHKPDIDYFGFVF